MSIGDMRMDFADYARDSKREGGHCAYSICMKHPKHTAPKGWSGRYGGRRLCDEHYHLIVDHIAEHGCLPGER